MKFKAGRGNIEDDDKDYFEVLDPAWRDGEVSGELRGTIAHQLIVFYSSCQRFTASSARSHLGFLRKKRRKLSATSVSVALAARPRAFPT
jgi:hypothetical protein